MNDEDLDGFILSPRLIVAILGPPPALTPEAAKMHTLILWAFAETIKPRDMIEWIYVRDCADYRSEIIWLRGLKIRIVKEPNKDLSVSGNNKLLSAGKVRGQNHRDKAAAELANKIKELKGEPDKVKEETARLEAEGVALGPRPRGTISIKNQYVAIFTRRWEKRLFDQRARTRRLL